MLVLDDFLSDSINKGVQWYHSGKNLVKRKGREALQMVA